MAATSETPAAAVRGRRAWPRRLVALFGEHRRHLLPLVIPWLLVLIVGVPLLWHELERVVREPALRARDNVRDESVQILTRALELLRHDVVFLADLPPELMRDDTRAGSVAARLFLSFSRSSGYYDKVRWLDERGNERLRVNNRNGQVDLVAPADLQNKAQRPFFSESVGLPRGGLYFSELDLNVEQGVVEQPLQPTLRIASPVVYDGQNYGVVVLNYRAQRLLDRLRGLGERQGLKLYLVNEDGYWLLGPHREDEWGWQLGHDERRLPLQMPELWRQINAQPLGSWRGEGGDWTWIDMAEVEVLRSHENAPVSAQHLGLRILVQLPDGAAGTLGWRWKILVGGLSAFMLGLAGFLILRLTDSMDAELARRRELERVNLALVEAGHDMQALQVELARAERLSSLGLMIAGVAHEMNTPLGGASLALSAAQSALEQLLERLDSGLRRSDLERFLGDSQEALEIAQVETRRAVGVVQRFKQVALDRTSLDRRPFDLAETLLDADVRLRHWDPKSAVSLELQLAEGLRMESYPGPLGQVITNLLGNALDHAFGDTLGGQLLIRAEADGPEHVRILFSDNGKGVPAESLGQILEPFFTTGRHRGNTGLGLHVVHQIVTQVLGGSLEVTSATDGPQRGTRFNLRLPRQGPQSISD
ncbi:MAG: Alginate biosynthesis sensor protein KinB [Stenotrophomonas maltophilia]|nr:MAG: Alginate biosynthesis sensor protein KinB [Stenotrophomonas maltophilia]